LANKLDCNYIVRTVNLDWLYSSVIIIAKVFKQFDNLIIFVRKTINNDNNKFTQIM